MTTLIPMIYEEGSEHMDCHIFDQWSVSHAIWGFLLGRICAAPKTVAAWKIGLLFVLWEQACPCPTKRRATRARPRDGRRLWENVIEVAFGTYAEGQYHGDSIVNSFFDMVPSMTGVWLGRHCFKVWPLFLLAEVCATRGGFGVHSVFLGHQGSICDVRTDPAACTQAYVLRLVVLPLAFAKADGFLWKALSPPPPPLEESGK